MNNNNNSLMNSVLVLLFVLVVLILTIFFINNFVSSSSSNNHQDALEATINLRGVLRTPFEYNEEWTQEQSHTIFVGVAAFRDVECVITVGEMFAKANNPRRVVLGIIEQNEHGDPSCVPDSFYTDCTTNADFCPLDNIRRRRVTSKHARGPTFGRYVSMLMYRAESYYMMIDSHNVFTKHWDRKSIAQLHRARSPRPVVSHYPNIWDKGGAMPESNGQVMVMCNGHYIDLGFVRMDSAWFDRQMEPYYQPFSAAGYLFSDARLVHEVLFDPYLDYLFDGEEILFSVRMWTYGYDLFTPGESVLYHDYARHAAKRYWNVPGSRWGYLIVNSQQRAQLFLKVRKRNSTELMVDPNINDYKIIREREKYGLGKIRTLEQYEKYAKIDPVHRIANFAFCQQQVKSKTEI